jgi:hypothetical protein
MLLVGYVFAIRSERRICAEIQVNLAYRWFCKLGIEDKIPDHSVFCRARRERFRESDALRRVFEGVVAMSIAAGGLVNAFGLWKPEAVRITSGAEHVATFQKTELSQRQYCAKCGGHLMTNHPPFGLVDVFAATLPTLKSTPGVHVNCAQTVLPMRDGVPKLRDFPKELGGSGEVIPE